MAGSHTIPSGSTTTIGYVITTGDGANFALTVNGEAYGGSLLVGVEGFAATPTIVNNNKIIATTATASSEGVRLTSGGRVSNNAAGLISASNGIYVSGSTGTVVNYGGITGASGIGVTLTAGGSVQNGGVGITTARIYGGSYGVKIAGGAGTVTNHAYIGAPIGGVFMAAGGYVYNAGPGEIRANYAVALTNTSGSGLSQTLVNAGLIDGGRLGIGLAGGAVTNKSSGHIVANDYAIQDIGTAAQVYNASGGLIGGGEDPGTAAIQFKKAAGSVANYGTINAFGGTAIYFAYGYTNTLRIGQSASFNGIVDGGNGVGYAHQSTLVLAGHSATPGTIANIATDFIHFNEIDVDAAWVMAASDTIATGMTLVDDGSLTNQGKILVTPTIGTGNYLNNASGGAITGASYGVVGLGQNQLVNDGSITQTSNGPASYTAVSFKSGGTVTNQVAGVIAGQRALAIIGSGSVTNMGQIDGTNFGFGVRVTGGGTVTNDSGTITGQQGVYISGGAATVTNFATIATTSPSGGDSVVLGKGFTNRVRIGPGATFANGIVDGGNTIGAASISTLELLSANASGVITPGTIRNLGASYVNFGAITVDPSATWTLASGGTVASGVTLTDNGSMTNQGLVLPTVTLAGTGSYLDNASGKTIANAGVAVGVLMSAAAERVVNYGTIKAAAGNGVQGTDGGSVTNKAGGTIKGATAIQFAGAAGTIVNAGLIANIAKYLRSVELLAGGTISNLGGFIYGGYSGILISGGAGSVINTGDISGAGQQALSLPANYTNRVAIGPGGTFSGSVNGGNSPGGGSSVSTLELMSGIGTLSGALGSQYANFQALTVDTAASWTVSGYLTGAQPGTVLAPGSSGLAAVSIQAGGSLSNQASMTGGTGGNAGTTSSQVFSAGQGGAGVVLSPGGRLTNRATIAGGTGGNGGYIGSPHYDGSTGGTGGTGVSASSTGVVDNFGTIKGGSGGAAGPGFSAGAIGGGVRFQNGGTVTNEAGATISGTYGVSISGGAGSVTNLGTISGSSKAVVLAAGFANTVAIGQGATFSGIVDGGNSIGYGGAVSTLRLLSSSSHGTLSGLGSQYVDFNALAVDPSATWTASVDLTGATGFSGGDVFRVPGSQGGAGVSLSLNSTLTNKGTLQGGAGGAGYISGILQNYKGPGGVGGSGIYASAAATLDNFGTILGGAGGSGSVTGAAGTAIQFKAGGTVTAESGGTIGGSTAISFGTGTSRLIDVPGAVFTGQVNGGSGVIRTLELADGGTGTLAGLGSQYVNFSTVTVDPGATWSVIGLNTITAGGTLTNEGNMAVNGVVLVNGTLSSSSTLLGVGVTADGSLIVENSGEVQTQAGLDIGDGTGAAGNVQVTGILTFLLNTGEFIVGDAAMGSLEIQDAGIGTTTPSSGTIAAIIANTASASGSSVQVSGAGSNWQVNGALIVGAGGFGQLDIDQSGSVTATSLDTGQLASGNGAIDVIGAGATLNVSGALTLGDQGIGSLNINNGAAVTVGSLIVGNGGSAAGDVVIGAGSTLSITSTMVSLGVSGSGVIDIQGGTLSLANGTTLTPGAGGRIVQVGGLIDPAEVFDASGGSFGGGGTMEASGTVTDTSVATVSGGSETVLAPLITSGDTVNLSGVWSIKSAGTVILDDNNVDISQTFSFGDGSADVLVIGHQVTLNGSQDPVPISADLINNFDATIQSFFSGDKIEVDTTNAVSFDLSGSVISLVDNIGGATEGTLTFHSAAQASAWKNASGALVDVVQCFAAGTRIGTVDGPVAVEAMSVGDRVLTHDGGIEPIVWIGQRHIDCARHPRPEAVWPVRIAAGAFGANVPLRDLYLSPDHAVFVGDVLVPVKYLINGATIAQVRRTSVTYYHVELGEHEVILAEDMPVESYLDIGDRDNFAGQDVVRLFPRFAARLPHDTARLWETRGTARLVMAGKCLRDAQMEMASPTSRYRSRLAT